MNWHWLRWQPLALVITLAEHIAITPPLAVIVGYYAITHAIGCR